MTVLESLEALAAACAQSLMSRLDSMEPEQVALVMSQAMAGATERRALVPMTGPDADGPIDRGGDASPAPSRKRAKRSRQGRGGAQSGKARAKAASAASVDPIS